MRRLALPGKETFMPLRLVEKLFETNPFSPDAGEVWLREADHRIANNLTLVGGLLRLQAADIRRRERSFTADDALLALTEAAGRIETVGKLHRRLAHRSDDADVDINDLIREVAEATVSSQAYAGRARLSFSLPQSCTVRGDQALAIALVIGELVTNSLKYAHPAGVAGEIAIHCGRNKDGALHIEVSDDGVGLPEDFQPGSSASLGLRLVHTLARHLGGKAEFMQEHIGLRVRLVVPALSSEPTSKS
jgi:two-component sensor histidine kinase